MPETISSAFAILLDTLPRTGNLDMAPSTAAREQRRRIELALDSLNQAVMVVNASGRLIAVNRAFTAITGYAAHEVLQRNPRLLKSGRHGKDFYADLWSRLLRDGAWQGEIWNRRRDGTLFPAWQSISVVRNPSGDIAHYVSVFSDISELKMTEMQLLHLAHHDPLTGLANRLLFNNTLDNSIRRAQRHGRQLALLFIDLNRFKEINDTLGHATGDAVLCATAARLQAAVRDADTVARHGGDEFTVMLEEIGTAATANETALKIQEAIAKPMLVQGREVQVTASVGVALYPGDAQNSESLIQAADSAMYQRKRGEES